MVAKRRRERRRARREGAVRLEKTRFTIISIQRSLCQTARNFLVFPNFENLHARFLCEENALRRILFRRCWSRVENRYCSGGLRPWSERATATGKSRSPFSKGRDRRLESCQPVNRSPAARPNAIFQLRRYGLGCSAHCRTANSSGNQDSAIWQQSCRMILARRYHRAEEAEFLSRRVVDFH